ncbi:M30 family zinc metallopeptidase [Macrococcus bovicus]|uniref:M30 family zinc metallopeptidase n=1 Tax=Macrococcus bovicus TaxID=69968 RepID=UPI0025A579D2|nr:neutral metalloprotease [Macrococcus bovicus]WJP98078.1 neutral metalloprotease [Macrococcus bovicus]
MIMKKLDKGFARALLVTSLCFTSAVPFSQPALAVTEQGTVAEYEELATNQTITLRDSLYEKHYLKLTDIRSENGKVKLVFDYNSRSIIKDSYLNAKLLVQNNGLKTVQTLSKNVKRKSSAQFVFTVDQRKLKQTDGSLFIQFNVAEAAKSFSGDNVKKLKIALEGAPATELPTTEAPTTEAPTSENPAEGPGYVVVNNERVATTRGSESTGMDVQSVVMKNEMNTIIPQEKPIMIDKNIELTQADKEASEVNLSRSQQRSLSDYQVGDSRTFNTVNISTNQAESTRAQLQYAGTKALVWVADSNVTQADAEKLGKEFDANIAPLIHNNFGTESDVDGNGKVNILLYDIKDGFGEQSRSYVGGYFSGRDLLNVAGSNKGEIFYMDTYPSMGYVDKTKKDVTQIYSTVAHEFQHMVNFNKKYLEQGQPMDTYLNEAFSMAAEHIYSGPISDRIDYYNNSKSIQNGHSLTIWSNAGDTLSNYSLSYLFGQYLNEQAGIGDRVYKEVINYNGNTHDSLQHVIHQYIDPNKTVAQFMTDFRVALLKKEPQGKFSLGDEQEFQRLNTLVADHVPAQLEPQASVVFKVEDLSRFEAPANKGTNISYTKVSE